MSQVMNGVKIDLSSRKDTRFGALQREIFLNETNTLSPPMLKGSSVLLANPIHAKIGLSLKVYG